MTDTGVALEESANAMQPPKTGGKPGSSSPDVPKPDRVSSSNLEAVAPVRPILASIAPLHSTAGSSHRPTLPMPISRLPHQNRQLWGGVTASHKPPRIAATHASRSFLEIS